MSAKEFFSTIDLSKLDIATATQIREEILTLSQDDWDLIDNDSEMEKQIDVIKQRLEKEFPDAIGLKSISEKVIDKKEEAIAKSKEQALLVSQQKEELAKKAEEELAKKKSEVNEKSEQAKKLENDIEEMQMLIELTQDTVKDNPTDEDLPMYLELLQDTLINLNKEFKDFVAKKKDISKKRKTEFADGGLLVINDTDVVSDNYITDLLVRLENEWGKDSDVYASVEEALIAYSKNDGDGDMYLNANGIKRINEELSEYDLAYRLTANGIVDVEELDEDTNHIYVYRFNDERGEIKASVEDMTTGIVVWEYNYPDYSLSEEEREFATTIVDDGFIKNFEDTEGLENYLKSLGILPTEAELISAEEAIQDYNYYANGGSIFSSGNHNSGRSWHLDRQKFNASEDWEKPLRKRKRKYKSGGQTDVKKTHEYRVMYSYKSKGGVNTDEFQDKDSAKEYYDKKISEDDIELVMMDYNEFNKYGKISDHKHLASYSWKDKPKFDNGGELLEKELRKLQRDLNSHRLLTYIEGDESDEAKALKKEREVKLARFNEVLQLLNEKEKSKFDNGGGVGETQNVKIGDNLILKEKKIVSQDHADDKGNHIILNKGDVLKVTSISVNNPNFLTLEKEGVVTNIGLRLSDFYAQGGGVSELYDVVGIRDGIRVTINKKGLTLNEANEMIHYAIRSGLYYDVRLSENAPSGKYNNIDESILLKENNIILLEGEPTIMGQIEARQNALDSVNKEINSSNRTINENMLQRWKEEHELVLTKLNSLKSGAHGYEDLYGHNLSEEIKQKHLNNKDSFEQGGTTNDLSPEQTLAIESIYEKYHNQDYWGYKDTLASQLKSWKNAYDKGDVGALKYTEQDIIDNIYQREKIDFDRIVKNIQDMIATRNLKDLISRIRYDQKVSLDIYEVLTGEKIKGKTNSQLAEYFNEKYGN